MDKKEPKWVQYACLIHFHMADIFNPQNKYFIDLKELMQDNNAMDFIYALASAMPTNIYNNLTKSDVNQLEFNHLINQLIFQYSEQNHTALKNIEPTSPHIK